jgi:hypothetical protein
MDDVDFAGWDLPPLDDADLPTEPPAERPPSSGVTFGSDLVGIQPLGRGPVIDVVEAAMLGFTSLRPGLLGVAELGSTDFAALTATERVDALIVVEQHRVWLDGVQQQLPQSRTTGAREHRAECCLGRPDSGRFGRRRYRHELLRLQGRQRYIVPAGSLRPVQAWWTSWPAAIVNRTWASAG